MQQLFEEAAKVASQAGVPIRYTGYGALPDDALATGRYVLDNGLTLLLTPSARAPIFAYQTWFKVGSKNEDPNLTGMAHFFEHLMFKGTKHYPTGTFDTQMERRGAQTNAATWLDWTYYTEALAMRADHLQTVIAFESDRMQHLCIDQETFDSELEVVKNERRMTVDDSISGTLSEHLFALAYTQHPYRFPTIGSMAHLEGARLADLQAFYKQHYAPNHATVVIVGDIDLVATLKLLAAYYGPIAAYPVQQLPYLQEPVQTAPRQCIIDKQVIAAQLMIGYRSVAQCDSRYAALEMLLEILVSGDTSRLYQRLVVQAPYATDISGMVLPLAEPGLVEFHIAAREDVDPQLIVAILQHALDALVENLLPQDLEKARNHLEMSFWHAFKDVEGCAEALGHYQTNENDFTLAFKKAAAWQRVTLVDLQDVAQEIFCINNRNVVIAMKCT